MKKAIFWQKLAAWLLFSAAFAALIMTGAATVAGVASGIYDRSAEDVKTALFRPMLYDDGWSIAAQFHDCGSVTGDFGNLRFAVTKADAEDPVPVLASNRKDGEALTAECEDIYCFEDGDAFGWKEPELTQYLVHLAVAAELPAADKYSRVARLADTWRSARSAFAITAGVSLFLTVGAAIWLCALAGRRSDGGIAERQFDRLPLIAVLALYTVIAVLNVALLAALFDSYGSFAYSFISSILYTPLFPLFTTLAALVLALDGVLCALFLATIAVRIKAHAFWKRTVSYYIVRFFKRITAALPLFWKCGLAYAGFTFVEGFIAALAFDPYGDAGFGLFAVLVIRTLLAFPFFWAVWAFKRIKESVNRLAVGNLGYVTREEGLLGDFRDTARGLNRLSEGLSRAVEARIKSERMKTELITNVSHDIKTPLTSIVSYADLIGREPTDNEHIREYADVLGRQAARLKKLLEDLVEASKAATGNIRAELAACDAGVFVTQTAGEYEERLAERGLTLVTRLPEAPVTVMADGRLVQRVLDNLMNNVVKYAKEDTRVFLELSVSGELTIKNTSRELIERGEELTERFVRGESARTSEGSGLGLAIAAGLMETMGGRLKITVDGDLFKAALCFGGGKA